MASNRGYPYRGLSAQGWVSGRPMGDAQFLYAMMGYIPWFVGKRTGAVIINTKTPSAMKQRLPVSFSLNGVKFYILFTEKYP